MILLIWVFSKLNKKMYSSNIEIALNKNESHVERNIELSKEFGFFIDKKTFQSTFPFFEYDEEFYKNLKKPVTGYDKKIFKNLCKKAQEKNERLNKINVNDIDDFEILKKNIKKK